MDQGHKVNDATGCGFDFHLRKRNIFIFFALVSQVAALSSATLNPMSPKFGEKSRKKDKFPPPTLLRDSVTLKEKNGRKELI